MSTDCGKAGGSKGKKKERLLSPKELLQIPIARDQVERYAKIKRKKKIESDPSIIFCPRTWCQGAMRTYKYPKITDVSQMDDSDSEAEEDDRAQQNDTTTNTGPEKRGIGIRGMERLQVCEDCNLAFCVVCLASWHGDFVRCEPRDATQLTEDDQASLNFILRNTSPCPYCSVPCQKSVSLPLIVSCLLIAGAVQGRLVRALQYCKVLRGQHLGTVRRQGLRGPISHPSCNTRACLILAN
jgi:E3 ubiquitin-protein ligase RNF14